MVKNMTNENKNRLVAGIVLLIAVLIPLVLDKPYYIHVLTMCLLWAYLASAWNIVGGFAGQLSLGHGIYTSVGAYVTVILFNEFGLSPLLGMFFGAGAAVLVSLIIGLPTFGLRGAYYALSTVAISEGLVVLYENTMTIGGLRLGGAEGLIVKLIGDAPLHLQFTSKIPYYYIALVMLLLIIGLSKWITKSRLGYYLVALREDEDGARALGIDVRRTKLIAGALSAFCAAIGGIFYAMLIRYLEPQAIAGAAMSTQMVFLAIVGGAGTVMGPVIGGILLALISEIIRFYLGGYVMGLHLFIYGLIVVLMIIYKPGGIIEVVEHYYRRLMNFRDREVASGAGDSSGS
ncbi:MAG: branched-chain amino acid ABC transporter permease [Syntrophomonadaceae bacterium]|jgi:branched-chain amino acid transport system permease protein|nr:branched-chain amino acid ABC transporter permease [Syntrophomonadaceae bacterium]